MSAPRGTDLETEQEVDFRRYGALLAARWWIVLAGLVAGLVAGYLLAWSGGTEWRATALMSLGQPFSPNGGSPVAGFLTNPFSVEEIVTSATAKRKAAKAAGMPESRLDGHVSSGKSDIRASLISIIVEGSRAAKVEKAANSLAHTVVARTTGPYVDVKIRNLKKALGSIDDQLRALEPRRNALERLVASGAPGVTGLDRVLVATQLDDTEQRHSGLLAQQSNAQQELALAVNVESARVIEPAKAVKTSAHSRRTSMLIGALIGLILGMIAAVLWEPLAARFATRTA